jgi:ADP-ribosylglycohydrolase
VVADLAGEVTALTHAHANSVAACVLWSEAIRRAVVEANPNEPFDFAACIRDGLDLVDGERRERWSSLVEEAVEGPPTIFNPNGWVVTALQAALSAIIHTPGPEDVPSRHLVDALETAVRVGHDTDTVAAIAGGLLGARWGASAVPDRWRSVLHGRRRSGEPVVEATDLEALTRRALSGY